MNQIEDVINTSLTASLLEEAVRRIKNIDINSKNYHHDRDMFIKWFRLVMQHLNDAVNFEFYSMNTEMVDFVLSIMEKYLSETTLRNLDEFRNSFETYRDKISREVGFHYFIERNGMPVLLTHLQILKVRGSDRKRYIDAIINGCKRTYTIIDPLKNYKVYKTLTEVLTAKDTYVSTKDKTWCVLNKRHIRDDEDNIITTMITVDKSKNAEININAVKSIFKVVKGINNGLDLHIEIYRRVD